MADVPPRAGIEAGTPQARAPDQNMKNRYEEIT